MDKKCFKLKSEFKPTNDQKQAIDALVGNHNKGNSNQVLLGVTGSGKTFTVANTIERLQKPALIISHNKTLAAQLYQEFREFFPGNAVSYFVSYYDYYQPEAYIPSTDTYIEKDAQINELIDKLRLASTTNILTRSDVIVICSVSCIYNLGSPREYANFVFDFYKGEAIEREQIVRRLIDLQYERGEFGFHRGTFRIRGSVIDIYPAYRDEGVRIELGAKKIKKIELINPVDGKVLERDLDRFILYPAKHFIADPEANESAISDIRKDAQERYDYFKSKGKELEAHRIRQKVTYDTEMIEEMGYVKGIENYSRYFDGRSPGDAPYTLITYFQESYNDDFLVFVDESHISFPQVRGMHAGDKSRKKTLIEYGFRLPSALDNRPLTFDEFLRRIPGFIATSATPSEWELSIAGADGVVEQLIRPTGIPDPEVDIRGVSTQVADVIKEIKIRAKRNERTLVTTLTKKTAEDLSEYLSQQGVKVQYLHSGVKTLERTDTLDKLRRGNYDVIVGVNLLREGLDLPEVSLVAILDADKEGFLRSEVSLTQTMGRAARHKDGFVILYADKVTGSMERALKEIDRRRKYQLAFNKKHGITPKTIKKPFREKLVEVDDTTDLERLFDKDRKAKTLLPEIDIESLTPMDRKRMIARLRREMRVAATDLNFELAIEIRDKVRELEG